MKIIITSSIIWIGFYTTLFTSCSKEQENIRRVTKELSSEKYYGRGVVNDGEDLAADYIKNEFKNAGLKSLTNNYFQTFSYSANTFPDTVNISVDTTTLYPGKDFTILNSCKSIKGDYQLLYLSNDDLQNHETIDKLKSKDLSSTFIVFDADYYSYNSMSMSYAISTLNSLDILGKIRLQESIPHYSSLYGRVYKSVYITARKSSFPKDAKRIYININSKYVVNNTAQNVIGMVSGESVQDSFIVLCGHYDHLGTIGKGVFYPGADDNASSIGVIIELANQYSKKVEKSKYSILFVAFGGEESGLVGSKYFVENPIIPLERIKIVLNLDMVGFGKDGLYIWNSDTYPEICEKFDDINFKGKYFSKITFRGPLAESDHHPFYLSGVKAVFITTGVEQSPYFHTIYDTYDRVTFDKANDLVKFLNDFIP